MFNRFETRRGGFVDMAVAHRKQPKTFLDEVDRVIDWKPIEVFLKEKLRRHKDAIGDPAYPALGMSKDATSAKVARPERPQSRRGHG